MRDIYKLEFDLFQDTTMVLYPGDRGSRVTRARCKASLVFAIVRDRTGCVRRYYVCMVFVFFAHYCWGWAKVLGRCNWRSH